MKKRIFNLTLCPETGAIGSVVLKGDPNKMNWCREEYVWGHSRSVGRDAYHPNERNPLPLIAFEQTESSSRSVYEVSSAAMLEGIQKALLAMLCGGISVA